MDAHKKEKITRFLNDKAMSEAVREVLQESFLKQTKFQDTMYLAASRIAIDLMHEAWKDLQKLKDEQERDPQERKQVGL